VFFTSIGKLTYPFLFLVFSLFVTPPVFGEGGGKEDKNSNGGGWEFDVGGRFASEDISPRTKILRISVSPLITKKASSSKPF
jgi:hypothetical protein